MTILQDLSQAQADENYAKLVEEMERLKAENARLRAGRAAKMTLKVTDKGGVSLYGINSKWPVTLYAEQWRRVLGARDEILAFIEANTDRLSFKE